jgi:hypothetical protein
MRAFLFFDSFSKVINDRETKGDFRFSFVHTLPTTTFYPKVAISFYIKKLLPSDKSELHRPLNTKGKWSICYFIEE